MNQNFNTVALLTACLFSLPVTAQSVLSAPDPTEKVYEISALNAEKELEKLRGEKNNEAFIAAFDALHGKWFDTEAMYAKLLSQNVDDWEISLFDARNAQVAFVKANADNYKINGSFTELIESSIKWNYWHLLLAYPILRSNNDTKFKRVVSLPRVMTNGIDLSAIDNPQAMQLASYRKFLPMAITYFNSEDKQFIKYADRGKLVNDKSEFAAKHLDKQLLDFYTTQLIAENCPFLTAGPARFFISNVSDEKYQNFLLAVCDEAVNKKEVAEEKVGPTGKEASGGYPTITDLDDKTFDFSAYKGKVVYVDFWASWCAPCRAEFPKSKEMHGSLTDEQKKQLVFLYISIDDNPNDWKKAVEQLGLQEFGENGHSFEVAGRYDIRMIPRYMIIDQKGEIVAMEATRPSDPETLQVLLKLIK